MAKLSRKDDQNDAGGKIKRGAGTVFAEGVAVLRVGSGNDCGHKIKDGSPDVFCP